MILSALSQADRYAGLHPLFPRLFQFIRETNLHSLPSGRHSIIGEDLMVISERTTGKLREVARLECHRRYIDLQLVLEGDETMGWKPLADCHNPVAAFDDVRDIQFFHDAPASWVATPPDHFCIFFPDDAHAPLVGEGSIHKVIFKILVAA